MTYCRETRDKKTLWEKGFTLLNFDLTLLSYAEMHSGCPIQILQQATHSKFMAVCQLCRWHKSSMNTLTVLKYWNFYNEDMPTFDLKVLSSEF